MIAMGDDVAGVDANDGDDSNDWAYVHGNEADDPLPQHLIAVSEQLSQTLRYNPKGLEHDDDGFFKLDEVASSFSWHRRVNINDCVKHSVRSSGEPRFQSRVLNGVEEIRASNYRKLPGRQVTTDDGDDGADLCPEYLKLLSKKLSGILRYNRNRLEHDDDGFFKLGEVVQLLTRNERLYVYDCVKHSLRSSGKLRFQCRNRNGVHEIRACMKRELPQDRASGSHRAKRALVDPVEEYAAVVEEFAAEDLGSSHVTPEATMRPKEAWCAMRSS